MDVHIHIFPTLRPPQNAKNSLIQLILTPFGHAEKSRDMVGSFWLHMDPGGCPGTRVMTIFVPMLALIFLIFNILMYVGVYEGI